MSGLVCSHRAYARDSQQFGPLTHPAGANINPVTGDRPMPKALLLLSLLIVLNGPECDPKKQDERITALEASVNQLKAAIVELKQKPKEHHFELRNEGLRTWRFDSATGETCIQLTSEADWKRKETKGQSCSCSDNLAQYMEMPFGTDQQSKWAQTYYEHHVQPACGDN
jgi:hypothetical protein